MQERMKGGSAYGGGGGSLAAVECFHKGCGQILNASSWKTFLTPQEYKRWVSIFEFEELTLRTNLRSLNCLKAFLTFVGAPIQLADLANLCIWKKTIFSSAKRMSTSLCQHNN